jgi:hypothetical protein
MAWKLSGAALLGLGRAARRQALPPQLTWGRVRPRRWPNATAQLTALLGIVKDARSRRLGFDPLRVFTLCSRTAKRIPQNLGCLQCTPESHQFQDGTAAG